MKAKMSICVLVIMSALALVYEHAAAQMTSFKKLAEAARKEGKLHIWYSTPADAKTWDALKEAFERRFNLKVDLTRTFVYSFDQPPRLAAEGRAGVLNADVVQVALAKPDLDLQKELRLYEVTDWAGLFGEVWPGIKEVAEFSEEPIRGYGLRAEDFLRVIVYNTRIVSDRDVPDTIEAFVDPRWRGKLAFGAPTLDPLNRIHRLPGWTLEKALTVGKALLDNKPIFARGSVMATDMVARGEAVVFLNSSWGSYALRKAKGAPIGFKPFADHMVVFGFDYAPLRTAPHSNMAKLFVAWYAMEGAQITEKLEYRSSVVHPGTQIKKIFDELKKGRVVLSEKTIDDVETRGKWEDALKKLVVAR